MLTYICTLAIKMMSQSTIDVELYVFNFRNWIFEKKNITVFITAISFLLWRIINLKKRLKWIHIRTYVRIYHYCTFYYNHIAKKHHLCDAVVLLSLRQLIFPETFILSGRNYLSKIPSSVDTFLISNRKRAKMSNNPSMNSSQANDMTAMPRLVRTETFDERLYRKVSDTQTRKHTSSLNVNLTVETKCDWP